MTFDCIELTYSDLTAQCTRWCEKIEKEFCPELVIFIAKAGYPIGDVIARYFNARICSVSAERSGNHLKHLLSPFFKFVPYNLRNRIIAKELSSGYHAKKTDRDIKFLDDLTCYAGKERPVLLVDDSVDTGNSLRNVKRAVEDKLGYSVKTASLNVWEKSREVIHTDFALYQNTIIKAPMSKDSKEYRYFLTRYDEYRAAKDRDKAGSGGKVYQ